MANRWVTSGDQFAAWIADFSGPRPAPAALVEWMTSVLDAGTMTEILRFDEAPLIGFNRERDGDLATVLRHRLRTTGVADVGHFASSGMAAVPVDADGGTRSPLISAGRLAYEDRSGTVVEDWVTDLGALLYQLRPELADETGPFPVACPAVQLSGPTVTGDSAHDPRWLRVTFMLRTDIYFPWVMGPYDTERFDVEARFDNRPLADRHTPRLNAFLDAARVATDRLGGRWELDPEQRFTLPGMLTETGINQNVCPPGVVL